MKTVLKLECDDAESIALWESCRPNYYILTHEGATSGGYFLKSYHIHKDRVSDFILFGPDTLFSLLPKKEGK